MDAVASEAGVGKATIYRRWRTKQDLVVDTISDLNRAEAEVTDTGSLEGDLRDMLHRMVAMIEGPTGAATVSLLSSIPHQPALEQAFHDGPLAVWRKSFDELWSRAAERGEIPAGLAGSIVAESVSALLVQRWLLTRRTVDNAYADEVLDTVVLPLIRATAGR